MVKNSCDVFVVYATFCIILPVRIDLYQSKMIVLSVYAKRGKLGIARQGRQLFLHFQKSIFNEISYKNRDFNSVN